MSKHNHHSFRLQLTKKQKLITMLSSTAILFLTFFILLIFFINKKHDESIETTNLLKMTELASAVVDSTEQSIEELVETPIEVAEEKEAETIVESQQASTSATPTGSGSYYIKINLQENVVTVYTKDSNGTFTVPYKAMVCSTGTYTPKSGKYTIKSKWSWLGLQGNVYGKYVTQINGNILFHSVPYTKRGDSASLEYWEFDKLGTSASLGCVRLQVKDSKWIYENVARGCTVEFYSSSDPGPLGKPSSPKISSNEANRNWDPTDLTDGNPWNNSINTSNPASEENTSNTTTSSNIISNTTTPSTENVLINNVNDTKTQNTVKNEVTDSKTNNTINSNLVTNSTNINNSVSNNTISDNKEVNSTNNVTSKK